MEIVTGPERPMRRHHKHLWTLTILASLGSPPLLLAEPFEPTDDAQVLERLPPSWTSAEQATVRQLRDRLRATPTHLPTALELAWLYWEQGRATLDPRYLGYTHAVLAPWWNLAAPPADVLLIRARTRGLLHDFEGALADLDQALRYQPGWAEALAARVTMLRVLGRLDEARASCLQLLQAAPTLDTVLVAAPILRVSGSAPQIHALLERTLAQTTDVPPEIHAYSLATLGELAHQMGDDTRARAHLQAAVALDPGDAGLRRTYADLLLDLGDPEQVVALLRDHTGPDALLLRLVVASLAMDPPPPEMETWRRALAARMDAARARGDNLHVQEAAMFALYVEEDMALALRLAKANWELQKEPLDARLLLAAAIGAGEPSAAAPVLAWMAVMQVEDRRLDALRARLGADGSGR